MEFIFIRTYRKEMKNKTLFTLYFKERHVLNPFKYIFGKYKFTYFEKDKQPKKYKSIIELWSQSIDLDIKE